MIKGIIDGIIFIYKLYEKSEHYEATTNFWEEQYNFAMNIAEQEMLPHQFKTFKRRVRVEGP